MPNFKWRDSATSDLTVVNDVLQDGKVLRRSLMLKDGATPCPDCRDGIYERASVVCPTCRGAGVVSLNGDPVDENVRNTANTTEAARGGAFGNDAVITDAQIRDRLAKDKAWRDASIGHRPGFRVDSSAEGRAGRQKVFDAMSAYDDERENAYKHLAGNVFAENTATLSQMPSPDELIQIKRNAPTEDRRPLGQRITDHAQKMETVYQEHSNTIQNAWRTLR